MQVGCHWILAFVLLLQYRSNVSYHLSSRFSQDSSRLLRGESRFSREGSRFSRESLKRSVWNILLVRSRFPPVKVATKVMELTDETIKKTLHGNCWQAWKLFRYIWFYLAELDDSNAEIDQIYRKSVLSKFLRCAVKIHLFFTGKILLSAQ